jgi:hypothetical protein
LSVLGFTGPFESNKAASNPMIPINSVYSKTKRIFSEILLFFT